MVNGLGGLPQIDRAGFPGQRWEPAATVLFFGVTAEPVLRLVAGLLARHRLDAVLIGNAAAALRGSPVTTVDLDFMFRKTPDNLRKVRRLADDLDAVVFLPYYPASELYRVVRDRDGLQLDFMAKIDGIRSFEGLRARATDPIRQARAAGRRPRGHHQEQAGRESAPGSCGPARAPENSA
jgi:hypothetical protein